MSPLFLADVINESCTHSAGSLDCLRKVDASLLLDTDTRIGFKNFLGTYSFVPVIDYDFIVERPMETLSRGRLNGVTLFNPQLLCFLLKFYRLLAHIARIYQHPRRQSFHTNSYSCSEQLHFPRIRDTAVPSLKPTPD
jgi:hypothetical protein